MLYDLVDVNPYGQRPFLNYVIRKMCEWAAEYSAELDFVLGRKEYSVGIDHVGYSDALLDKQSCTRLQHLNTFANTDTSRTS